MVIPRETENLFSKAHITDTIHDEHSSFILWKVYFKVVNIYCPWWWSVIVIFIAYLERKIMCGPSLSYHLGEMDHRVSERWTPKFGKEKRQSNDRRKLFLWHLFFLHNQNVSCSFPMLCSQRCFLIFWWTGQGFRNETIATNHTLLFLTLYENYA